MSDIDNTHDANAAEPGRPGPDARGQNAGRPFTGSPALHDQGCSGLSASMTV